MSLEYIHSLEYKFLLENFSNTCMETPESRNTKKQTWRQKSI